LHLRKAVLENASYAVVAAATAEEAFSVFNSKIIDLGHFRSSAARGVWGRTGRSNQSGTAGRGLGHNPFRD
jgi:hypothetical protein